MKDFKFLSALALTGMLSAGIAGTTLAAGNTDWTKVLKQGSLNPTVVDKDVVGYLLTDKDDKVTVEEMLGLAGYTSLKLNDETSEAASDRTVTTGASYVAGNKTEKRHVGVYNEVDEDGDVDVDDVVYALDIITGAADAEDLQKEAADVAHDGEVTTDDVIRMLQFQTGEVSTPVDPVPAGVADVEELTCDIVVNENNVVNNTTKSKSTVVVATKSKEVVNEDTKIRLVVVNDKNEEQELVKEVKIAKNSNQKSASGVDFSSIADLDLENVQGKKVTVRAYDENDNLVGTTEVTVDTTLPEAVEISAQRDGTRGAKLSFNGYSDSDIAKFYYTVDDQCKSDVSKFFDKNSSKIDIKEVDGLSNSFDDYIDVDLTTKTGEQVYFVVEDSAGNRSENVYTAIIPADDASVEPQAAPAGADEEENAGKVTVDDNLVARFEPESKDATVSQGDTEYVVRVYDESGKLVKEYAPEKVTKKDLSADLKEAGKYTVKVFAKGNEDGTKTDSEAISSDVFEIKQLSVSNVTITKDPEVEDGKGIIISWEDVKHVEGDKAKEYKVTLKKFTGTKAEELTDETKWEDAAQQPDPQTITITYDDDFKCEAKVSGLEENVIYRAEVEENAEENQKVVLSTPEPVKSETNYFIVGQNTITVDTTKTKDTSATLKVELTALNKLGISNFTYDVKLKAIADPAKPYDSAPWDDSRTNIQLETTEEDANNGYLVIDGLEANTNYIFVVTMKAGDVTGTTSENQISDWAQHETDEALHVTTLKSAPTTLNGKVTKKADTGENAELKASALADSSLLWADESSMVINGEEFTFADIDSGKYEDTNNILAIAKAVIKQLHNGDSISVEDKVATVTVDSLATSDTGIALTLDDLGIETLRIDGNKNNQTINTLSGVKELVLAKGDFTLSQDGYEGVTVKLDEDAYVLQAGKVTLLPGAENITVNKVSIYAEKGVDLDATTGFVFEPSEEENDIRIVNNTKTSINVTFNGNSVAGETTLGKVTIDSNAGVTVKTQQNNGRLDADLVVNVTEGGTINVQDQGITGVDVTVSNSDSKDSKVHAYAKNALPEEFEAADGLVIKEYTNQELEAESITGLTTYNKENAEKLRTYLEDFRSLFGKGITLKANKDNTKITLSIPKGVSVNLSEVLAVLGQKGGAK